MSTRVWTPDYWDAFRPNRLVKAEEPFPRPSYGWGFALAGVCNLVAIALVAALKVWG